jgi:deoxyuridine 5'-triphosphate nucleotidohydrolase
MASLTRPLSRDQQVFYVLGSILRRIDHPALDRVDGADDPSDEELAWTLNRRAYATFAARTPDIPHRVSPVPAAAVADPDADATKPPQCRVAVSKDALGLSPALDLGVVALRLRPEAGRNSADLLRAFLQGAFHACSGLTYDIERRPICWVDLGGTFLSRAFGQAVEEALRARGTPPKQVCCDAYAYGTLEFIGTGAVDVAGWVLEPDDPALLRWLNHGRGPLGGVLQATFRRVDPDAVLPSKAHPSDVGYDLTVLRPHKQLTSTCALYDTGVQVAQLPPGTYFEIHPRSSLSKSGYMLANSTGIIDPGYTDNLYVALVRVDPDAPPLTFPFRAAQLILRTHWHVGVLEAAAEGEADGNDAAQATARGKGGFGSSGGGGGFSARDKDVSI